MKHAAGTTPEVEAAELNALTNEAKNLKAAGQGVYEYPTFYGEAYDPDLTTKEIAAKIRSILRKLAKTSHSPLAGAKVSVTSEYFSGGSAVRVKLGLPFRVNATEEERQDRARAGEMGYAYLTPAASAAKKEAEKVHDSFNYDGSNSMIDYFHVNYYGHVDVYELT